MVCRPLGRRVIFLPVGSGGIVLEHITGRNARHPWRLGLGQGESLREAKRVVGAADPCLPLVRQARGESMIQARVGFCLSPAGYIFVHHLLSFSSNFTSGVRPQESALLVLAPQPKLRCTPQLWQTAATTAAAVGLSVPQLIPLLPYLTMIY